VDPRRSFLAVDFTVWICLGSRSTRTGRAVSCVSTVYSESGMASGNGNTNIANCCSRAASSWMLKDVWRTVQLAVRGLTELMFP
jgi:hypothetical protein